RVGPPLVQPYRDLRRLLGKEAIIADNTSWLFRAAPYVIFAATWVATALVPTFATGLLFSWSGDLIAIVALLGLARFLQAAAAIVALAENARIPVDNPATHLELTMVHEAMVLEYSGRHLAMLELAVSLRLLLYVSLIACIFVPFGLITDEAGPLKYGEAFGAYV